MKTMFTKATLVLALGATALTVSAPAQAQQHNDRHHNRDSTGTAIIAGVAGLAIGAVIASSSNTRRAGYPQQDIYRSDNYWSNDDWNNGGDSYAEFQREYQHISRGIQLSLNDGSLTRYEARQFSRDLQRIQQAAYQSSRYGDYEGDYIQQRLEQLHERIHDARERGNRRGVRYGSPDRGQGYNGGYQGGYDPYRR